MADLANIEAWFLNPGNRFSARHRRIGSGAEFAGENSSWTLAWKNYFSTGGSVSVTDRLPFGHPCLLENNTYPSRLVEQRDSATNAPSSARRWDGARPKTVLAPYTFPEGYQYDKRTNENVVNIVTRAGVVKQFLKFGVENWNGTTSTNDYRAEGAFEYRIDGPLHGSQAGQRFGSSASGMGDICGLHRTEMVLQSGLALGYACGLIFTRKAGQPGHLLGRRVQWPAVSGDGTTDSDNKGPFPYGGWFALPPQTSFGTNSMTTFDNRTIALSEPGVRMAIAAKHYGFFVIDGGPQIVTRFSLQLGSARNTIKDDYEKIVRELRYIPNSVLNATAVIANSGAVSSGSIGTPNGGDILGGGTPIAINTALDAGGTPPPPPPPETRTSIGWVARRIVSVP